MQEPQPIKQPQQDSKPLTKARLKRLREIAENAQRTRIAVCVTCWMTDRFKDVAHKGTMVAMGKDSEGNMKYEHQNCPARRNNAN